MTSAPSQGRRLLRGGGARLAWQTVELRKLAIAGDRYTVYVGAKARGRDCFNDIPASLHYPGGLALRFARVKRYRPDKSFEEADTIETVLALYKRRLHKSV